MGLAPTYYMDEFMLCFCESIYRFPARCARPECAFGPTHYYAVIHMGSPLHLSLLLLFEQLSDIRIIVRGVGESMGSGKLISRTTRDRQGTLYEETGRRCEGLRCRLITEVRASSGLGNLAETSRFYSADFLRDSRGSAEPVVFLARDAGNIE